MNVQLRHGIGDVFDDFFESGGLPGQSDPVELTSWGDIDPATGLYWTQTPIYTATGDAGHSSGGIFANTAPLGSGGGLNPTALANAIAQGAVVASRFNAAGVRACPSGYQTPSGACVAVTGAGVAGSGTSLIAGISNQTLALVGIGLLALMMMGGRKR